MNYIGELLKGIVIGVANILPGISGGMLAVSMGVYDTIIHGVNRLFKEPLKSIRILFPYGLGAVAGIVFLSLAFEYLFNTYPLQIKMAFLGLIGGGLPPLLKKAFFEEAVSEAMIPGESFSGKRWSKIQDKGKAWLTICATCMAVLTITAIAETIIASAQRGENAASLTGAAYLTSGRFWVVSLFFIGLTAAATMVVPGISGSMIMMMLGVYEPLLQLNNACIRTASRLDLTGFFANGSVLLPYLFGLGLGIFLFAGLVERFLIKRERQMYRIITGLVFSSPFVILWGIPWENVKVFQILAGLSLALLGYVAARALGGEG